ncbi:MAG: tetratricopeptide repeat protein, partial [Longimicrobiales bacterium]|nr:tetratricopeptide repeat protein [Longimicrobiales bacterium]
MSIESLKQKARTAEQKEDWTKALELYKKALTKLEGEDQVDIGLYNRVGDLHVRVDEVDQALEHYQKAVELYRDAYLPNNAIAVCKKILRSVPDHHRAFLVIGQIRAEQGFIPDARANFLTYAERVQQEGELDESFRALVEFCDLAPDDVGVRLTVAEQMASHGREHDAVEQLLIVRDHYREHDTPEKVAEIEAKILTLDPDADLSSADEEEDLGTGHAEGDPGEDLFGGEGGGRGGGAGGGRGGAGRAPPAPAPG